jgi:hypothetical protein
MWRATPTFIGKEVAVAVAASNIKVSKQTTTITTRSKPRLFASLKNYG